MKTRQTWAGFTAAGLVLLLTAWGAWSYRSPLLDSGGRNFPERIADFFAYSWYYSKALWLENTRRPEAADAAAFTAAWFRPSLLSTRFQLDPSDPLALAGEYEQIGLGALAGRLLELAAARTTESSRLAGIVSLASVLGDWERLLAVLDAADPRLLAAAHGDYWRGRALLELGRSAEAIPYLERAAASDLADASYRLFLALRAAGRSQDALATLLAIATRFPDHVEMNRAIADISPGGGKAGFEEEYLRQNASLTPALPVRAVFGGLRVLGFDPPSSRLTGEETLRCRMYYEVIGPSPEPLFARLSLERENRPGVVREAAIPAARFDPGVVHRLDWEFPLPAEIVPGPYRVTVGVRRAAGDALRRLGSREEEIACGEISVLPGVFAVPYADRHLGELFGTDLDNLRLSSVINGRDRVIFPLAASRPRSGIGIVSYTQWSTAVPQGTRIALLEVKTAEGESHRFPIEAGVETADIWLGERRPDERAHGFAPLYRSREVARGGGKATAHAYYFVFRLPRPARLTSATVEYVPPAAGALFIQNVFLL